MEKQRDGIAIVGIACKFPGANTKDEFWNNLIQNKESITFFSDNELEEFEYDFENLKENENFVKARAIIDGVDKWDSNFFNMTPKDAAVMDPQQRLWLSNTWHAFEDAGINPYSYQGNIGVFAGANFSTYLLNNVLRDDTSYESYIRLRSPEIFQTYNNNEPMFLATKTAYFYDLTGPAISVQTACSTSLVAVAQACNSLLAGESDACVAGGVTIVVPQQTGYVYQQGAIVSPDGHCRPFDKDSKGTVFGNGVGSVILKRIDDAIRDNDRIYAVIKGWATNNDGKNKMGFTAPSIEGQKKVITSCHSAANVNPEEICYIEAHGTATPLGDPIEVTALSKAFGNATTKKQFCGLGSVKSNIGHLDSASGIAGLIKTALSAHHRTIPATLHYKEPNPFINFKNSPFFVVDENIQWTESKPMNMGVSSFGVGGTNAHVLLSDYLKPKPDTVTDSDRPALHILSAKSASSLNAMENNLREFIDNNQVNTSQIAAVLQFRRAHLPYRSYSIAQQGKTTITPFTGFEYDDVSNKIVFLFPGQGAQYVNMGKSLYETEEVFRKTMDECFTLYQTITGSSIENFLFSDDDDDDDDDDASTVLAETRYTQPALFIIEYALVQLYLHYCIKPDYCMGHSIGEYTAACVSGVFDLETALKIVIKRGELMCSAPTGSMMAVPASKEQLTALDSNLFEIAAINAPGMCTISFQDDVENELVKLLEQNNLKPIPLQTSHAFHSKSFESIMREFSDFVDAQQSQAPGIPFISCLTGEFITPEQATNGDYWARQLRNAVLFSKGIETLAKEENLIFIEIGPNTHLRSLLFQNDSVSRKENIFSSLAKLDEFTDQERFYKSLGEAWMLGVDVDFSKLYTESIPEHISLPLYSFEEKRCWVDFKIKDSGIGRVKPQNQEGKPAEVDQAGSNIDDDIETKLGAILSDLTGIAQEDISNTKSFRDLNIESLALARLAVEVEKHFKTKILFRDLVADYNTISKLAGMLSTTVEQKTEPNKKKDINQIYCLQPEGDKPPLFIVYADKTLIFEEAYFGTDRPVYAFVWPGSDGEKTEMASVKEIALNYLKQIKSVRPNGPYYLCGFSFGGIVTYELAVQLQKAGEEVPCISLIDIYNPSFEKVVHVSKIAKWKKIISERGFVYSLYSRFIVALPNLIVSKSQNLVIKTYNMLGLKMPVGLRNKQIMDHAFKLIAQYKPVKYQGDVLLYTSDVSPKFDEYLGWREVVNSLEKIHLTGDHIGAITIQSNREIVSKSLREFLSKY